MTGGSLTRRDFVLGAAAAGVALAAAPWLGAQSPAPAQPGGGEQGTGVPGATMEGDGYRPVTLPPKPGGTRLTDLERDAVERMISCPCPCTLDVFTCRTSMACGFSPRMHSDVIRLIEGGHSADEILAAFVNVYGEQARMAPEKRGFSLVGWVMPFAALGAGAVAVGALIRRWGARAAAAPAARPLDVQATPDELARLDAALRRDDDE